MTQKLQRHKDTRKLPNSTTHHLCRAQEAQTHTTSGAAHAIDQKSRRCANEENVHQTEMLGDPLIIVRGKELVAPDPTACDHHPAAWSGPAPADRNRTAGAAVAPRSSSACSRWTPWVLTAIHERRTAKSRCFASSCEEVPTENSICGSSLGTFQLCSIAVFLPTSGMYLRAEFWRS